MSKHKIGVFIGLVSVFLVLVMFGGCDMGRNGYGNNEVKTSEVKKLDIHVNEHLFFKNPLGISNIGDPFILKAADGKYYLYATSDVNNGFKVWVSEDMIQWEARPVNAYSKPRDGWGFNDFWAPEVYEWDGMYHMYYSARLKDINSLRIGHAVSDNPEGPFVDVGNEPMFDFGYAVIDGHVFIDSDGRSYFYYSRDCSENVVGPNHESHIYGVELDKDMHTFIGTPKVLTVPSETWELQSGDYRWNEGPFVVKVNEKYYLNYSGNFYGGKDYSVGYAVSDQPLGPFVKGEDSRLTFAEKEWDKISGSGHNMLIPIDGTSLFYTVYHTHSVPAIGGGNRSLNIGVVGVKGNGQMFSNAPNIGKQLVPEYFEKALAFESKYDIYVNGEKNTDLSDHEIALYSSKMSNASIIELSDNDVVEIKFDGRYKIDTILLYDGNGQQALESVELEFDDESKVEMLTFPAVSGEPAVVSLDSLEVSWIRIRNNSKNRGSLSEVVIVPVD